MLLQMLPEQISNYWNNIEDALVATMPEGSPYADERALNNILQSLVSGRMHCWLFMEEGDDNPYAMLLTSFLPDPAGAINLFVYSIYGYRPMTVEMWTDMLEGLKLWGRKNMCNSILAFSDNDKVLDTVKNLGANVSQRLISLEVRSNGKDI